MNNSDFWKSLIVTVLFSNPVIIFLLTKSLSISIIIPTAFWAVTFGVAYFRIFRAWTYLGFITLVGVISLLVHAEVLFRYGFPEYNIEDLYSLENHYYFNKPGLNKLFQDKEFQIHYRTNRQGFRIGTDQPQDFDVSRTDWLFLGDSYTQGAQVEFENLYTSTLYRKFPDKIITNAGISGFGLPEEFACLEDLGRKLKPEKVILQICNFNDFMNVSSAARGPIDYLMHYSDLARYLLYKFRFKQPGELPLGRWTEPFYEDEQDNADYNVFYKKMSEKKNQDLYQVRTYIEQFKMLCKSINSELIILLIPTKEQIYPKYFEEVINSFRIDVSQLDMNYPNSLLSGLCDSLEIPFVDLTAGFIESHEEVFYEFDEHLNSIGHSIVAEELGKYLESAGQTAQAVKYLSQDCSGDRYPVQTAAGKILFQSYRNGNMEIFLADTSMRSIDRVTFNNVDESHPYLLNASELIFTEGDPRLHQTSIVRMKMDGSARRSFLNGRYEYGAIPTSAATGMEIAYAKWSYDTLSSLFTKPQIVRRLLTDDTELKVTNNGFENWRPMYSPDGKKIVYISNRSSNFDIYLYDIESQSEMRLTNTPFDEWDPSFSPDGDRIIYAARMDHQWDLFEYEFPTQTLLQITSTSGDEWDPSYSFDGKNILFGGQFGTFNGIYKKQLSRQTITMSITGTNRF